MGPRTTWAVRMHGTGGPEMLRWEEIALASPGPGQILLRHTAVGLNFVDVMMRRGLVAHAGELPLVLGRGAAGVVEAAGEGVHHLAPGDRVAYAPYTGAYAQRRLIDARCVVRVPDGLADDVVGASILQGLTAHYLLRQIHRVEAGDVLLVHAAAGGVGLILCQWAAALGAQVIGTMSTPEKARLAQAHGCHHAVLYTQEDVVQRVAALTKGRKVDVVYDAVGGETFTASLDCLRPGGKLVSYGSAGGPVAPLDVESLGRRGALSVTRGTLLAFSEGLGRLQEMGADWFDALAHGEVRVQVQQRYRLRDAQQAHRDLEQRRTTGSSALIV